MSRTGKLVTALLLLAGSLAGCVQSDGEADSNDPVRLEGAGRGASVYPGSYDFTGTFSHVLAAGILKRLDPVHVFIKSKLDGADIEIGYWLPDVPDGVKVPVLVHASPYHRPAGAVTTLSGHKLFLAENFLPHGYAVAAVAVRGTANSGGCMDLMGKKEVADLDQAITWLGEQPWSSGAISMSGVSYDGSTPWSVAAMGNKYLKTIVPISGVPDVYGLMFRNGSAETRGPAALNALYYEYSFGPTDPNRAAEKRITGAACPESLEGFEAAMYSGTYGERDARGWWAERNRKPLVEKNYQGSILSIQGFQDWNVDPMMVIPWVDQLNQTGVFTKQISGQWGHASPDNRGQAAAPRPWTRYDWAEILLHWFDYWLKDVRTIDLGPSVQVQNNRYEWRNLDRLPPSAEWSTYHLNTGNKLGLEPGSPGSVVLTPAALVQQCAPPPAGVCPADTLRSTPGYRADFAVGPFDTDVYFTGLPRLHVTVAPKGPTGHLSAFLYDVDEAGKESLVGRTTMNLMFADGSEKAKPIVPNAQITAKMEFQPLDVHILPGHKLKLTVWESTDSDRLPAFPPEPVELFWGGSIKSTLELPIVHPAPEDFFVPPLPPDYKPTPLN